MSAGDDVELDFPAESASTLHVLLCIFTFKNTLHKVQTERYMNGVVEGGGTVKQVFLHVCVFWQVGLSLSESLIPRILRFLPIFPR